MQITAEQLLELDACEDGVADFRKVFPNGFAPKSKAAAVRMCKRASHLDFDWAAENLLNYTALDVYQKATAPARGAYEKAKAPALDAYMEAMAQAWDAYEKAKAPALDAYQKAEAQAWDAYQKAEAQAWDACKKAKAQAFARAWWDQEHS